MQGSQWLYNFISGRQNNQPIYWKTTLTPRFWKIQQMEVFIRILTARNNGTAVLLGCWAK
ncbi:hypothetical protein L9F63_010288, partial [Diploptera punctata]